MFFMRGRKRVLGGLVSLVISVIFMVLMYARERTTFALIALILVIIALVLHTRLYTIELRKQKSNKTCNDCNDVSVEEE